jgi:predicted nucleic acid-binding protein
MTVLIDTNVLLDLALKREPWFKDVVSVLRRCRASHLSFIAWHTLPTLYYVMLRNKVAETDVRHFCRDLVSWVRVASAQHSHVLNAFAFSMADFEDALQASVAESVSADWVLTRNTKDFEGSPVPAISPTQFLNLSLS